MEKEFQAPQVAAGRGSETVLAPQEAQRMVALQALGWEAERIDRELGCSHNTVLQYLRQGGWRPMDVAARAWGPGWPPRVAGRTAAPAPRQCRRRAP